MNELLLMYYVCVNIAAMTLMAVDKQRARERKWRIKEATIWFWSIVGGAAGAALGMYVFRHKIKHKQFKAGLPLLAVIHAVFLFRFI